MEKEIQHLLSLLDEAADEMMSYENASTFSYFDTCEDVGSFIQKVANKVKNGELDEISKLWYVFAPTGVWDDSGGSQEIANEIFVVLNEKYRPD